MRRLEKNIKIVILFLILLAVAFVGNATWKSHRVKTLSADYTQAELQQIRINYQATTDIIAELDLIHTATKTKPRPIKVAVTPRRPRHVWRKALSIYGGVGGLKIRKGLLEVFVFRLPKQNIKPIDVYDILQSILEEARIVRQAYGIAEQPKPAPLPPHALPMDVYRNLNYIAHMIGGIEDRAIRPSHVYQIAVLSVLEIEKIRVAKNINTPIDHPQLAQAKRPRDVYNAVFVLSEKLQKLSENPGYAIPGGVVLLNKYGGRIIPEDVINMLSNTLADIEEIRFSTGDYSATDIPQFSAQLTPSNVYDKVNEAILLVETLL